MELIVGTNCYTDLNEADELINSYLLYKDPVRVYWNNILEDEEKKSIILSTTQKFDRDSMCYKYFKLNTDQSLQFPRITVNKKIIDCPIDIKLGLLIQGIKTSIIDKNDEYQELKAQGIKSYKIKDASVEFFENTDLNDVDTVRQKNGMFQIVFSTYFKEWTEFI